jgi:hypothetical protein
MSPIIDDCIRQWNAKYWDDANDFEGQRTNRQVLAAINERVDVRRTPGAKPAGLYGRSPLKGLRSGRRVEE